MKKIWLMMLLAALAAAVLTGCASSADTLSTPTPGATGMPDNMLPGMNGATAGTEASPEPMASGMPTGGIRTLDEAKKASHDMEEAIEKLSEVDEAYVVAVGDTALVGLKFTSQYQGEVDDRLKKMVLTRVQTVDKTVERVAVTSNEALAESVHALAKTLKAASSLDDVNGKMEELLRQITVYTE